MRAFSTTGWGFLLFLMIWVPAASGRLSQADMTAAQEKMELKESNRKHFYDVRIESLDTSIRQINIMYRQNQISHALITHETTEAAIFENETQVIQSTLQLLKQSLDLVDAMQRK
jgi:hypothetical protein